MCLHREHIWQGLRATNDEGHPTVPGFGVLHAAHRLEPAAAASEAVAEGPMLAIHLGGHSPRVLRRRRARSKPGNGRILAGIGSEPTEVRFDHVGAAVNSHCNRSAHGGQRSAPEGVLGARYCQDGLEEASFVLLSRRKVKGKTKIGVLEATVHIAVASGLIAPLVDVHVRLVEFGVLQGPLQHAHSHLVSLGSPWAPPHRIVTSPQQRCRRVPVVRPVTVGTARSFASRERQCVPTCCIPFDQFWLMAPTFSPAPPRSDRVAGRTGPDRAL